MNLCQHELRSQVDAWVRRAQHAFWPSTCVLCGQRGRMAQDLCAGCENELPSNAPACHVCSQPLPRSNVESLTCGACLRRSPAFDASCVPFLYAYPISHLIRDLKYSGRIACARVLGELVSRHFSARFKDLPAVMIPVPLATRRYRERGYNQVIEVGVSLERTLGVPMCTDVVVRTRATLEQAELNRAERRRNVRNAFEARRALPADHVAILDDVVTTASTVNELARVLRRAGARRIEVWAIARAGLI
jgi:ComF family protein